MNNLALLVVLGVVISIPLGLYAFRYYMNFKRSMSMVFLLVKVPRVEDEKESQKEKDRFSSSSEFKEVIGGMEQFFDNLYTIFEEEWKYWFLGQEFLSFEIAAFDGAINFYIVCPKNMQSLVEKQVTSFYSEALVEQTDDYNIFKPNSKTAGLYMRFTNSPWFPFKSYQFTQSDPLSSITNVMSKFAKDEGAVIQIMVRPARDGWQAKGRSYAANLFSKGSEEKLGSTPIQKLLSPFWKMFSIIFYGVEETHKMENYDQQSNMTRTTPGVDEKVKAIENKCRKIGYETIIRIVTSAKTHRQAKAHLSDVKSSFSQYSTTDNNSLTYTKWCSEKLVVVNFIYRHLKRNWLQRLFQRRMICSSEELASLFHFPSIRYNKAPGINWLKYKIAQPPDNLPEKGLLLGHNHYRGVTTPVYMNNEDRFRHFYVIGQTGTGKSSIFQAMARQDFREKRGCAVIDPHGSLVEDLLPFVPRERADEVIIFNPADLERPLGINLLDAKGDDEKEKVAQDLLSIMIKLFNEEIFGPRIQDYFRNGVLTLMAPEDEDEKGTIVDIVRLFTDSAYEKHMVAMVKNPVIKNFWTKQMAQTGQREKQEMIPYFAAKFGAFITNKMMRNILGQQKSAFDVRKAMQEGKLMFFNLSKGMTGDFNAKLLGMLLTTSIQNAALARETMAKSERKDFFLYIDEFQNFITPAIESILSEARKYRLGLCLAHQYIKQLEGDDPKSPSPIKEAVFGNVGTMMCYKIGSQDAEFMEKEMAPVFSQQDLINIDKFKAVMKLSIDTQPSRPFSITPLNPYLEAGDKHIGDALKQLSRLKYGRDVEFVDKEICRRIGLV